MAYSPMMAAGHAGSHGGPTIGFSAESDVTARSYFSRDLIQRRLSMCGRVTVVLSLLTVKIAPRSSAWTDVVPWVRAVVYQEGRAARCLV